MRLVTFRHEGADFIGTWVENRVVFLARACSAHLHSQGVLLPYLVAEGKLPNDMLRFLAAGERALAAARQAVQFVEDRLLEEPQPRGPRGEPLVLPPEEVTLLAPVPRPGKLLCIGLNYRDHAEETGMKVPDHPILFAKFSTAVVGPGDPILLPAISDEVDYEAELAVVIGRTAKNVTEEDALQYVAGYTVMNDVSARDIQFLDGQWMRGKTLDSFAPMGPALVTRDEVPDPHRLRISLRLNGETMQSSSTSNLVFGVPQLVSFLSRGLTLEPGDVIATGTPPGVGMSRKPPVYLKPGDVVVAEVEGVGVLENPVAQEA